MKFFAYILISVLLAMFVMTVYQFIRGYIAPVPLTISTTLVATVIWALISD